MAFQPISDGTGIPAQLWLICFDCIGLCWSSLERKPRHSGYTIFSGMWKYIHVLNNWAQAAGAYDISKHEASRSPWKRFFFRRYQNIYLSSTMVSDLQSLVLDVRVPASRNGKHSCSPTHGWRGQTRQVKSKRNSSQVSMVLIFREWWSQNNNQAHQREVIASTGWRNFIIKDKTEKKNHRCRLDQWRLEKKKNTVEDPEAWAVVNIRSSSIF